MVKAGKLGGCEGQAKVLCCAWKFQPGGWSSGGTCLLGANGRTGQCWECARAELGAWMVPARSMPLLVESWSSCFNAVFEFWTEYTRRHLSIVSIRNTIWFLFSLFWIYVNSLWTCFFKFKIMFWEFFYFSFRFSECLFRLSIRKRTYFWYDFLKTAFLLKSSPADLRLLFTALPLKSHCVHWAQDISLLQIK